MPSAVRDVGETLTVDVVADAVAGVTVKEFVVAEASPDALAVTVLLPAVVALSPVKEATPFTVEAVMVPAIEPDPVRASDTLTADAPVADVTVLP